MEKGPWLVASIPITPFFSSLKCTPFFFTVYILAQVAGGFVGAASSYAQYLQPINIYEGGPTNRTVSTAGLFASFPVSEPRQN